MNYNLERKGRNLHYTIFAVNEAYTCMAIGSADGYLRVMVSPNFLQSQPLKEYEIHLENQVIKHVKLPNCLNKDINRQSVYYSTQNGIYYIQDIEKNKRGGLLTHVSPVFCGLNTKGHIIFVNSEEGCIERIDPADRSRETKIFVEGNKQQMLVYKDYVIVVYSGKMLSNKSRITMSIINIDIEFTAFQVMVSGVKAIIPAIDSVFLI